MKEVKLSRNFVSLVDDEDYELVSQFNWFPHGQMDIRPYAIANSRQDGRRRSILMHRLILNPPAHMYVDHIDGNSLNNQRSNLRICTKLQNNKNRRLNKNNTSGYKGVNLAVNTSDKKWVASIFVARKRLSLGYFKTPREAALIYNKAALKYFGEFARLNTIEEESL